MNKYILELILHNVTRSPCMDMPMYYSRLILVMKSPYCHNGGETHSNNYGLHMSALLANYNVSGT